MGEHTKCRHCDDCDKRKYPRCRNCRCWECVDFYDELNREAFEISEEGRWEE